MWHSIVLKRTIGAIQSALIVNAVLESEHVTDLMHHRAHRAPLPDKLGLLLGRDAPIISLRHEGVPCE